MQRIAVFGKGGIGKSTLAAGLAAVYAQRGLRVLLVGCDPKHDTTVALTDGRPIRTVVEQGAFMNAAEAASAQLLTRGRLGIDCIEAGGPEPGIGCGGRGISRMIELLEGAGVLKDERYDVALFDVLGDVVCGGFAAPLRQGFADKVVIVASDELMALYAANNIARAVRNYSSNGVALCGLLANLRDPGADRQAVERFASLIGTRVLAFLTRDGAVREAERRRLTVVEHAPRSRTAKTMGALAEALLLFDKSGAAVPTPLGDERFHALSREGFVGSAPGSDLPRADAREQAPAAAGRDARPPKAAVPAGPDIEMELKRQAGLGGAEPGENSQVWGHPEQWRRFYCDFETRRQAPTRLEASAPLIHVWHQDLECSYATPDYSDASLPSFFNFPFPRREERGAAAQAGAGISRDVMTNLNELDVICGGGRKLDEAIAEAVSRARSGARAVVVHSTCVPTVIGDDARAIVARWQARSPIPIVYTNPAENSEADAGLLLFKKIQEAPAFSRVRRKKRAINLVGFPEGAALRELEELLSGAGIAVNARVMPRLSLEEAGRYLQAEMQVFYPNDAYEAVYREVFEALPIRSLRLAAPYGLEATRVWLESLARELGRSRPARVAYGEALGRVARDWESAAREAAGHGLAFVVDAPHIGRLSQPSRMWGVPVIKALREMGFQIEILCHGPGRPGRPGFSSFETPEQLRGLLKEGRYEAVYSEYAFDSRLARAGKAQFALDVFEMGPAGALRALKRLNAICRWPFYRRYARYLREG